MGTLGIGRAYSLWYAHARMFGYPERPEGDPPPEPNAEATTLPIVSLEEMDSSARAVFSWRMGELLEAGFDELRATSLALKEGDAWRRAIEHVKRGATQKVAADIEL